MAACSQPVEVQAVPQPCGKCPACITNHRRSWTGRLLMESFTHPIAYFATLTYAPEYLPAEGSLNKEHAEAFRKRLAYYAEGQPRFFMCGEYGDKTSRPHYHAILYMRDPLSPITEWVQKSWPLGFSEVALFSPARAAYVAGYTLKKMTKAEDPRLGERHPEFRQMSRLPALGDEWVKKAIAPFYTSAAGAAALATDGDVAPCFRYNGKMYPFSRRHRIMIRRLAGIPEKRTELMALNPDAFPPIEAYPDPEELRRRRQMEANNASKREYAALARRRFAV